MKIMKKVLTVVLAVAMVFSMAACGEKKDPEGQVNMPNPFKTAASLDELNEMFGCKLSKPAVMGVSDESFVYLQSGEKLGSDSFAEYRFTVAGYNYTYRFAPFYEDISGIYVDDQTLFAGMSTTDAIKSTSDCKAARWANIAGQYVLSVKDDGKLDMDSFTAIAREFMQATSVVPTEAELEAAYEALAGEYTDRISQRAVAEIEADGSKGIKITVRWADSAMLDNIWTMTASFGEDGLLYYKDCKSVTIDYADAENPKTTPREGNYSEGFFGYGEDKVLYWNGSEEDGCKDCEFVRVELEESK